VLVSFVKQIFNKLIWREFTSALSCIPKIDSRREHWRPLVELSFWILILTSKLRQRVARDACRSFQIPNADDPSMDSNYWANMVSNDHTEFAGPDHAIKAILRRSLGPLRLQLPFIYVPIANIKFEKL
jgi:hypothetical protein